MIRKLITLIFVVVTVEALSLRSTKNEEAIEKDLYRLPTSVVPIHYDLKIESNIGVGNFNFSGETDTRIDVREPTKEIVLNWLNLTINESQTRLCNNNDELFLPIKHLYDHDREMLTLVFENTIVPAIYTLHIEFSGGLPAGDFRGFYGSTYKEEDGRETWIAVAHFQPISARKTFPCWDEPAIKATFNISVKHHANCTAISNMPAFERSNVDGDEAKVWTRFERTPIMSTHILGFVIGDLGNISTPDGSIRVWARKSLIPHLHHFFDIAQKVNDHFVDYMNTTVAVPKMDHVAVPEFSSRATENWGITIYREVALAYYPNKTTMEDLDTITMLAIHEMTHQWISNLVGPHWWTYMWMSEGFAAYFQFKMLPKFIKDPWIKDEFLLQLQQNYVFQIDTCLDETPMTMNVSKPFEIPRIYSYVTYRKAPMVLHMLAHSISEEVFRTGLLNYVNAHKYKTAMPDDLWRSMQDALDQSNVPHEGFKIKDVMDTWTQQSGYPSIIVSRDNETGEVNVRQDTRDRISSEECPHKWWVPLNFATQANPDFSSTLPTHWLSPTNNTKTITDLPKDGWIIANIQQTGYYRVKYDLENWRKLASYLNSDDYTKIHAINRYQIINDAFYGAMAKEIPYDVFGMLMNYLSRETDPLPLMAALRIAVDINNLFKSPETAVILKPYIQRLLSKNLEYMDYYDRPDDERVISHWKLIIKDLSCMADVPESLGNATVQLIEYLENPNLINILPESRNWVFCCGLRKANQSTWSAVLDIYKKNHDNFYLRSLACSDSESILMSFLNMTLSDDTPFLKEDIEGIYYEIIAKANSIAIDLLLDFLGENLDELNSKISHVESILYYLSSKIVNMEQLNKMIAIFESKGKMPDELKERMEQTQASISETVTNLQIIVEMAHSQSKT